MNNEWEFVELINPYQSIIYKICLVYADNKDDLNDLFQESLLNLFIAYPSFRSECKLSSWVYRVTLNTCISDLRKRSKMQFVPFDSEWSLYEDCDSDLRLQEMYALIKRLNKFDRALILLWLEDRSYEEIAAILNLSKTNISVRLCRIREKLKQMFNKLEENNHGTR